MPLPSSRTWEVSRTVSLGCRVWLVAMAWRSPRRVGLRAPVRLRGVAESPPGTHDLPQSRDDGLGEGAALPAIRGLVGGLESVTSEVLEVECAGREECIARIPLRAVQLLDPTSVSISTSEPRVPVQVYSPAMSTTPSRSCRRCASPPRRPARNPQIEYPGQQPSEDAHKNRLHTFDPRLFCVLVVRTLSLTDITFKYDST